MGCPSEFFRYNRLKDMSVRIEQRKEIEEVFLTLSSLSSRSSQTSIAAEYDKYFTHHKSLQLINDNIGANDVDISWNRTCKLR